MKVDLLLKNDIKRYSESFKFKDESIQMVIIILGVRY